MGDDWLCDDCAQRLLESQAGFWSALAAALDRAAAVEAGEEDSG